MRNCCKNVCGERKSRCLTHKKIRYSSCPKRVIAFVIDDDATVVGVAVVVVEKTVSLAHK